MSLAENTSDKLILPCTQGTEYIMIYNNDNDRLTAFDPGQPG